ncbi:MAG: type II secretion system protein GspL [Gammaproteobacteria bacterium]
MRDRLFIRLGSVQPGTGQEALAPELSWLRMSAAGVVSDVQRRPLSDAAAMAAGRQLIVLVPGSDVLLTQVAVPSQNRQRIARAIPFALEERLGTEIEQLHFALGARGQDNQIATAVVDRARMNTWLEYLRAAGLQPDILSAETLALPTRPGSWFVLNETGGATVRTGLQSGFAIDSENVDALLAMAVAEAGDAKPAQLHIIDCTPVAPVLAETLAGNADLEALREACKEDALVLLARGFDEKNAINLLQGDYSRREQIGKLWRPWRPAIALLLAWLILQGGMAVAEVGRLSRQAQELQPQIEQIFRNTFPGTRKIVNARVQMERNLEALRAAQGQGGGDFLKLLENTGAALKATPDLQLRSVSYKEGELNLEIDITDLQALDQLKQRLTSASGLDIKIQSATSRDGKVQSRLQIRPKGTRVNS